MRLSTFLFTIGVLDFCSYAFFAIMPKRFPEHRVSRSMAAVNRWYLPITMAAGILAILAGIVVLLFLPFLDGKP